MLKKILRYSVNVLLFYATFFFFKEKFRKFKDYKNTVFMYM